MRRPGKEEEKAACHPLPVPAPPTDVPTIIFMLIRRRTTDRHVYLESLDSHSYYSSITQLLLYSLKKELEGIVVRLRFRWR